jgi:hypothetical protein
MGVHATAGTGAATVVWSEPVSNPDNVTGYTVTSHPSGLTCSTTSKNFCTVKGLALGEGVTFTVAATSNYGTSFPSAPSDAVIPQTLANLPFTQKDTQITQSGQRLDGCAMVVGPDGNFYIASGWDGNVWKVTPSGQATLYARGVGCPNQLASAPDGTLYAAGGNQILSISTMGEVKSIEGGYSPEGVTVGPDGYLYFSNNNSVDQIDRISPNGGPWTAAFTFPAQGSLRKLTFDGNGNLFVQQDNGILELSPSGTHRQIIPNQGTQGLALSPNGDVYTISNNALWQINGAGVASTVTPINAYVFDLGFQVSGDLVMLTSNNLNLSFLTGRAPIPSTAPKNLTAGVTAPGQVSLHWSSPDLTNGAPITNYVVTSTPIGSGCQTSTTSCTIPGLISGRQYTFDVRADNGVALSQGVSSRAITIGQTPSIPVNIQVRQSASWATISWSAVTANGSPVTGYTVTSSPGGLRCSTSTISCKVSGLTPSTTYTFTVSANSAAGSSFAPSDSFTTLALASLAVETGLYDGSGCFGSLCNTFAMALGPGGNLWLNSPWQSSILHPDGSSTFGPATGSYIQQLQLDQNGNAWFSMPGSLAWRANSTSFDDGGRTYVSTCSLGACGANITGLTIDRSGNALVTIGADIFEIFPNGTITHLASVTSDPNSGVGIQLQGIALGLDGTIYVSNQDGSIYTVGSEAAPLEAPVLVVQAAVDLGSFWIQNGLAAGPDGNLYLNTSVGILLVVPSASTETMLLPADGSFRVGNIVIDAQGQLYLQSVSNPSYSIIRYSIPSAPTSPSGVSVASPGSGQVTISWNASTALGVPVTGYTVTASPGGATCTSTTTSCTIAGLSNGTTYTFTVVASDIVGDSDPSTASSSLTVGRTPSVPVITGTQFGQHQVTVNWTRSTVVGSGTVNYVVQAMTTDSPSQLAGTCSTTTLSCSVSGLTDGVPYTFSAVAFNASGSSTRSESTSPVVPMAAPESPTAVTALVAATGAVKVSWQLGDSNGSPLRSVVVTASPGGATCSPSDPAQSWCVVSGLTNGSLYSFSVVATNAVGSSLPSAPSNISIPMVVNKTLFPSMAPGSNLFSFNPGARSAMLGGYFWVIDGGGQLEQFSSTGSYLQSFDLGDPLNELSSDGLNLYLLPWVPNPQGVLTLFTIPVVAPVPSSGPAAPTLTSLVPGKSSLTAHWTPPSSLAGSIVGYTLTIRQGSKIAGSCSTKWSTSGCKIGNLQDLVNYSATVVAFEKTGNFTTVSSNESAPLFAIPVSPIGAPKPIFVSSPVKGSATLRWFAASSPDRENVTYLVLVTKADGTAVASRSLSGTTTSVSNLVTGVRYTATITASTPATTSGLTPSTSSSISFVER